MDITARKRAMCVAALWIVLPGVLGASLNPSRDSPPSEADTRISVYTRSGPPNLLEDRAEAATAVTRDKRDAARPPTAEAHAICDFTATFPSGRALCFWIQW